MHARLMMNVLVLLPVVVVHLMGNNKILLDINLLDQYSSHLLVTLLVIKFLHNTRLLLPTMSNNFKIIKVKHTWLSNTLDTQLHHMAHLLQTLMACSVCLDSRSRASHDNTNISQSMAEHQSTSIKSVIKTCFFQFLDVNL